MEAKSIAASPSTADEGAHLFTPTSKNNASLAKLIVDMLKQPTSRAAASFVSTKESCKKSQRIELAQVSGLEKAWQNCNQSIDANVRDMAKLIVTELYEPFWFYRRTILTERQDRSPRALFNCQMATLALKKRNKFWTARTGRVKKTWLPKAETTFDAVLHFVQAGSGTGVHIGNGKILTCAHVVDSRDDDDNSTNNKNDIPERIGRKKLVMFASGVTFLAECIGVNETPGGEEDVALMELIAKLDLTSLPTAASNTNATIKSSTNACSNPTSWLLPPAAAIADKPVESGERLFCIGNPSNVDLESLNHGEIDFEPPTWHASVGKCKRGNNNNNIIDGDSGGGDGKNSIMMHHTCWTYWGHSGAPLFNEEGKVVGMHCAWDDKTGMRHGQMLQSLRKAIDTSNGNDDTASHESCDGRKRPSSTERDADCSRKGTKRQMHQHSLHVKT